MSFSKLPPIILLTSGLKTDLFCHCFTGLVIQLMLYLLGLFQTSVFCFFLSSIFTNFDSNISNSNTYSIILSVYSFK